MNLSIALGLGARSVVGGVPAYNPAVLFENGEQGAWYDPSDLSTLWADVDATIPAVIGGRVARMDDKSGRGNHALQATEASRPFLRKGDTRYYLDFFVSSTMSVAAFNMSATDEMTVIAGVRKANDTSLRMVCELTTNAGGTTGGFFLTAPFSTGASGNYGFFCRGNAGSAAATSATALAPRNAVITGLGKISTDQMIIRRDGVEEGSQVANQGTGNFANAALHIGSRAGTGSFFASGELYGLVIRGNLTTGADLTNAESYMTSKTGDGSLRPTQAYALGDSTIATFLGGTAVLSLVNTDRTRVSLAVSGNTAAQQQAAWVAATITPSTTGWVGIQVGLNDVISADSVATIIGNIQSLVNTVTAEVPDATVFISQMNPARQRFVNLLGEVGGEAAYQKWLAVNEAIAGNGSTPITGVDGRVTAHVALLNDGSGNLRSEYQTAEMDGIHPNTAGRLIVADAWEDVLRSLSVPV